MACQHLDQLSSLKPPRLSQQVHREECTQCFDNQDGELGIDVCLTCFNGSCLSKERHHALTHHQKTVHPFSLNIKRTLRPRAPRKDEEPPLKKLAIVVENEEEKYNYETTLRCWGCGGGADEGKLLPDAMKMPTVQSLVDAVMASSSFARQSEVKAWEEEIIACEHTLLLQQNPVHIPVATKCSQCDLKDNLWLCLGCGNVGCGRQQYGGLGGNGHALRHFEENGSDHGVCVKLGTITPEGNADVYCYVCNDSRLDNDLAIHLLTLGIPISAQKKTEKSITEMQIEQNLKFDFSMTDESGEPLKPVTGPGLTGLQNLGNSCYMASTIQVLFSLKDWRLRYLPTADLHSMICPVPLPAECVDCQMHKLADGLLSGRYSFPRKTSDPATIVPPKEDDPIFQEGLRPIGFKTLIGKGHEEFATMRQQDSEEFFGHLVKVLRAHHKKVSSLPGAVDAMEEDIQKQEPTEIFRFGIEQRLQCGVCKRVRYRVDECDVASVPVPAVELPQSQEDKKDAEGKKYKETSMEHCIGLLMGEEDLEYDCEACEKRVVAIKRNRFASFPRVLVIQARKFQSIKWVPTKLDVPVILPLSETLTLDALLGKGIQSSEEPLPEDSPASQPQLPEFNATAMAQLEGMGFPTVRCQKALLATGNKDAESAMEWLFEHMEDPGIDEPIQLSPGTGAAATDSKLSPEQIAQLCDMGFTAAQAKKALRETGNNTERAVEWLFSHPDDTGEDAPPSQSQSTSPAAQRPIPGTTALPSNYKLCAFISHKGPSVHSGHYIAHIRTDDGWVLFNDEKVVKADQESVDDLKKFAYLYFFERV